MNKEQPILKIRVGDRHYSDISFVRAKDLTPIDINISTSIVIRNKLFNQDIFEYDSSKENVKIHHSSIRSMPWSTKTGRSSFPAIDRPPASTGWRSACAHA